MSAQKEKRALREKVGGSRAGAHHRKVSIIAQRQRPFDAGTAFLHQADKIVDRAKMDIGRVVPIIIQGCGARHAAIREQG